MSVRPPDKSEIQKIRDFFHGNTSSEPGALIEEEPADNPEDEKIIEEPENCESWTFLDMIF